MPVEAASTGPKAAPDAPPRRRGPGRPKGSGRWNDQTIRQELLAYTQGMRQFPRAVDMVADGQGALRAAISHAGGVKRWAELIDLPLDRDQDRTAYSEAEALRDARELIPKVGRMPGKEKTREMGYARLASFMHAQGLGGKRFRQHYADQLGDLVS